MSDNRATDYGSLPGLEPGRVGSTPTALTNPVYELKPCYTFSSFNKPFTFHGGLCDDCRARFDGVKRTNEFTMLLEQFRKLTISSAKHLTRIKSVTLPKRRKCF